MVKKYKTYSDKILKRMKNRYIVYRYVLMYGNEPFSLTQKEMRKLFGEMFERNKYFFLDYIPAINKWNGKLSKNFGRYTGPMKYKWKQWFIDEVYNMAMHDEELYNMISDCNS